MYIGKIHKKKRLYSIYIVKHIYYNRANRIALGERNGNITYTYKKNIHYNLGKIHKKKSVYSKITPKCIDKKVLFLL